MICFRERNRLLSHGQLSWSFVDELGLELASRHPWLLTFLKSPKCVFSDGSTYNSWKAAAGITAAGCHELVTAPSDMSLTHISESADLISFDDELPVSTPRAEGVVSDVFVDDSPLNPSINDDLLDDRSLNRIEGLLCEMYQWTGRTAKATNELVKQMNVMTTAMNQVGALSDQFKQQEQKIDMLDLKFEQKIDNLDQKFNRQEQKIDNLDQKFNQQNQQINNLDQKFELKFDNLEQQLDSGFQEKFDNFEQKLDVRLREQLEQFESNFNDKLDTVISERLDANLSDRMQTEFDKFEGELDLKFVKLRGEVMQVSEKFTDLQSAMTDELSNFRSTIIQEIDSRLDVKFNSVDEKFENLETNIIGRVELFEMSVNSRMDCIDEKVNIVNDKVDEIHTQVKELDQRIVTLENKVELNHVLVMKRIDSMEDQISAFKTDQNLFNITVEQKLGMLDQFGKDNASALSVIEKVANKNSDQILELSKMIDWTKAEIRAEFSRDLKSQHDQFQCELGNLSDKLGNQFNSQFEKISTTFNDHIKVQFNNEFMKSNVTDVFSALVNQAVADITSEVKVVKDSVESTAMDIAICKDRLDAADKHFDELMNNQDRGIVHHSYQGASQSILRSSTPISSADSTPIILKRGQDVMSQVAGPTGIGESQYRGNTANNVSTGIGSEDQCREDRLSYVNDTSARQTSTKRLNYLNKSEGLLTCPANMSFGGGGNYKNTADDDFVNRRGPNRTLPTFDGTGDVEVFFHRLEFLIKTCEWPEKETVSRLMSDCLQGEAASMLTSVPKDFELTYLNIKKKLYTYFSNRKDDAAYKQQLLEIVREPKESLQAFCKRVAVIANKAYPDSAGEREKAGVLAIVRGCRSDMVKYAALANTFKAETIDDAVQQIVDMENRGKAYHLDADPRVRVFRSRDNSPTLYGSQGDRDRQSQDSRAGSYDSRGIDRGKDSNNGKYRDGGSSSGQYRTGWRGSPERNKHQSRSSSPTRSFQNTSPSRSDDLNWRSSENRSRYRSASSSPDNRGREQSKNGYRRSPRSSLSPNSRACYTCGDHNHFARECPQNKNRSRSPSPITKSVRFDENETDGKKK